MITSVAHIEAFAANFDEAKLEDKIDSEDIKVKSEETSKDDLHIDDDKKDT